MALSKIQPASMDLTANYAFTGTTTGVTSTQKIFLIKNLDASSSATRTFIDGSNSVDLDNTYKTYLFRFVNVHPASDNVAFQFNGSADTGSNYNVTKTTTVFEAGHDEAEAYSASLAYDGDADIAQGTGFMRLARGVSNDNDHCVTGELWLFNPSSTTFVKHFFARTSANDRNNFQYDSFTAGYFNTTSAVDAIQFKMASGDIDAGTIEMYGIN